LAGFREAAWDILGLLLGVRRVVSQVKATGGRAPFVNFLTDGDHTFFADGVLTHNCGVGGTLTGRGADICLIDDPHTEAEATQAAYQPEIYDKSYEWYTSGPRQRLQPNGAIVVIATRWSARDLIGRVIKDSIDRGKPDEWEVIEFPAILPSGNPLWPEYWSLEELTALKAELPPSKWNAQYQQKPTGTEGAIIKREWWKRWTKDEPPPCEFVIQAWDTAYSKGTRNDYSACTTWGVFCLNEDPNDKHIILLDRFMDRLEFPELKAKAKELYDYFQPDTCIIEAKASGLPLIFELRQMGLLVSDYTPARKAAGVSNDKIARTNAIADIFSSGKVWAPETRWADELIDNMAAFPNSLHDDDHDTAVMALTRFRQGGFLRLDSDYNDNEDFQMARRAAYY
jgi:predicted phage terminase large subunit-like protein